MRGKLFGDRLDAGRHLASRLTRYADRDDVIVLALPRGGALVGFEIAHALHAPLDVFLVRKLGVPGHPELAMGAIASGGVRVVSRALVDELGIADETIEQVAGREAIELQRREHLYRGDRPPPLLENRIVILVDDGLATGSTMEAAIAAVRQLRPARIIAAAPVGARESCGRLEAMADEVVCAEMPEFFHAVGEWYATFDQTTDDEVVDLLSASAVRP